MKFLLVVLLISVTAPVLARWPMSPRRYTGDLAAVLAKLPKDAQGHYVVGKHLVRIGRKQLEIVVPDDDYAQELAERMNEPHGWNNPFERLFHGEVLPRKGARPDYLVNLNEQVQGNDGLIIGREREIEQITNALRRKGMKGIVLVGDPGVGKTAIVEGLARKIVDGNLPELADREIFSLDVVSLWGADESKYVGQLHKRVNHALQFVEAKPEERILFIDEIHQLLGGGHVSMERSAPPITDILKPALARGDLCCIGATTHEEYQTYIEKDRAIKDRLLRIDIDEPLAEDTLTILRGLKESYEEYHGIVIAEEALQAAVNMSNRYLQADKQPRKAIKLLDEAAAVIARRDDNVLNKEHIAAAIAEKIGLQVDTILKSKNDKAAEVLPALQAEIFGQEHVHEEIAQFLLIALTGLTNEIKPQASFLLGGPTGTGKTATAKVLARTLFDREDNLIHVGMGAYKSPADVGALSRFLTHEVKARPYSLILLDEIEKAHPEVQHLLLQLLEEGHLADSRQQKVDFSNTIVVLTTNSKDLSLDFSPEMLNRFNRIFTYRRLDDKATARLVQKQLAEFNLVLKDRHITITLSNAAAKILAQRGYSQESGAREMQRVFDKLIKYPVAEGINRAVITSGNTYSVDLTPKNSRQVKVVLSADDEVVLELTLSTPIQKGVSQDKQNSRSGFL